MASKIYKSLVPLSEYMDRKFKGTKAEYDKAIAESPWCARAARGCSRNQGAGARACCAAACAPWPSPARSLRSLPPFVRSLPSRAPSPRAPPAFAPSLPPRAPLSPLRDSPPPPGTSMC